MSQPVDTANLDMLKEVIGDDLKEILLSFAEITPDTLAQMEHAIQNQDAEALRLHAHSLKGSAANVGAQSLSELCFKLEEQGKAGVTEGLEAEVAAVHQETDSVISFLHDYLKHF